mmetsp:Transcript_45517/g.102626  ORF Transcript_45517/g.102626 Transcript_45517/m.102626 type:complete len:85 (-) Transcript_45517:255-509(-)
MPSLMGGYAHGSLAGLAASAYVSLKWSARLSHVGCQTRLHRLGQVWDRCDALDCSPLTELGERSVCVGDSMHGSNLDTESTRAR